MADFVDRSLECEVCCEQFDHLSHRPKLLSCGHTVCMACVKGIHKAQGNRENVLLCPIDRNKTHCHPSELKDNFYVMSLIEESTQTEKLRGANGGQPRFWCLDCKSVAVSKCVDMHAVRRLAQERHNQLEATMNLLDKDARTQLFLAARLETIETLVKDFAAQQVAETKAAAARGQEALTRLSESLHLVGPEWDLVEAEVERARQDSRQRLSADELPLQLLAVMDGKCKVRLAVPGAGTWRADVDLQADVWKRGTALVRALLVLMHRAVVLRKEKVRERQTKHRMHRTAPHMTKHRNACATFLFYSAILLLWFPLEALILDSMTFILGFSLGLLVAISIVLGLVFLLSYHLLKRSQSCN